MYYMRCDELLTIILFNSTFFNGCVRIIIIFNKSSSFKHQNSPLPYIDSRIEYVIKHANTLFIPYERYSYGFKKKKINSST